VPLPRNQSGTVGSVVGRLGRPAEQDQVNGTAWEQPSKIGAAFVSLS